jgi:hypothetical protein
VFANLREASDDDILDVIGRVAHDQTRWAALDAELARREGVAELPPPEDTSEQKHIDDLVRRGWSYADAYAEAYGRSGRDVERDQVATLVDRRAGETLEQATRRAYAEVVTLQMLQAEEATRGNLVSRHGRDVDPRTLWSAPAAQARRQASQELMQWWEANGGRLTYAEFKAQLGTTRSSATRSKTEAARLAGSGRDYGL